MRMWKLTVVLGLLVSATADCWAQPVALKLDNPEGRTLQYKHTYRMFYFSNQAEILFGVQQAGASYDDDGNITFNSNFSRGGTFEMDVSGEWESREEVVGLAEDHPDSLKDVTRIKATILKADSRAVLAGKRLSFEQYPDNFEKFKDREFSWFVNSKGEISDFEPEFYAYRLGREDLVTDLFLAWVPEYSLTLPDKPVSEGDTWEGEGAFKRQIEYRRLRNQDVFLNYKSSYRVKKIKRNKEKIEVEIEEEREVSYKGWIDVTDASFVVDGKGTGTGKWVVDAANGMVLEHKIKFDINRPKVMSGFVNAEGNLAEIPDMVAEVKVNFERKLKKIERE